MKKKGDSLLLILTRTGRRWPVLVVTIATLLAGTVGWHSTAQEPVVVPVLYVDTGAAGAADGTSWANAYVHLQDALDEANGLLDAEVQIWIAAGIYYPDVDADGDHVPGSRDEAFSVVRDGVQLYGGFDPGAGVIDFGERDPGTYPAVLSGDVDRNDQNADGNGIAETWADVQGANAYHVVLLDGRDVHPITHATILDGLIITAGQAHGVHPQSVGGGVYCRAGGSAAPGAPAAGVCSPTLIDTLLSGNQASQGGGIHAGGRFGGESSPTLHGVTLRGNLATHSGGGLYSDAYQGTSHPVLEGVVFDANLASDGGYGGSGGGMASLSAGSGGGSSPIFRDTLFVGNHAGNAGGGLYLFAGDSPASSPVLERVTFRGNEAGSGGGMFSHGYGGTTSPVLIDVAFERNVADTGGGLEAVSSHGGEAHPALIGVLFHGNVAQFDGGGMANIAGGGTTMTSLVNVLFSGNQAGASGGGLLNAGDAGSATITLTNVTLSANHAGGTGGGVRNASDLSPGTSGATVTNAIFWRNSANAGGAQIDDPGGAATVATSLVEGGFPGGLGILDADPLFERDPSPGGDGVWGTDDDNYGDLRLSSASPAIDAGDNDALPADSFDLDGDGDRAEPVPLDLDRGPRFVGAVDMGAYETAAVDLEIDQVVSALEAVPGTPLTYTLTLTNHGPVAASGIVVTDIVPVEQLVDVAYQASVPVTPGHGIAYTWQLAALSPHAGGTIWLTGRLAPCLGRGTQIANTAEIAAAERDRQMGNNVDRVETAVLNAPPVAVADVYVAPEGVLPAAAPVNVLSNDADANCDDLSAILVQDVEAGSLLLDPTGDVAYTAPAGFEGTVTFAYRATDGQATSAPVTAHIVVGAEAATYRVFLPLVTRQ